MNEWYSIADCGYPKDDTVCMVTYVLDDGTRIVDDSYTHLMDVSKLVDKRTNEGKRYIAEHPDGIWRQWHSDGFWKAWKDTGRRIIAWMPYPDPYEGD